MFIGLAIGCDDTASKIARESADRQAEQSKQMVQLTTEVAAGTHQLVEADAKARQAVMGVHRDLEAERSQLSSGWDQLEQERRQIASQRRTDSVVRSVATIVGEVLLVLVLVGLCWFVLLGARRDGDADDQLNEFLLTEFLNDGPLELPAEQRPSSLIDCQD
jgi:hypothetical protein